MPKPVDVHVGDRVRQARVMKAMSQTDLGKAIGVSFQQVQKYEKGTNRIAPSRLYAIAKALEHPITYFFEGLDETGTAAGPVLTRQMLELCRSFHEIKDPKVRETAVDLIHALGRDRSGEPVI